MICAGCGAATEIEPCASCGRPPLLDARYRLEAIVGRGAKGITYRATALADSRTVAIKELAYRHAPSAKGYELIRREAAVLEQLEHSAIPRFLEAFEHGQGKHRALYLVQEFIEGKTLRDELERRRLNEVQILEIVDEIASILEYLHQLAPPVIHRDLKPANVMRRSADETLVLIDFGAVAEVVQMSEHGGSTIAGTYGFMAPEQFRGEAHPATDLYALGALLVGLLSRRDPATLMGLDGKLAWEGAVVARRETQRLLSDLLQMDPRQRESSATRVRERIQKILSEPRELVAPEPAPLRHRVPARREVYGLGPLTRGIMTATLGPLGLLLFFAALATAGKSTFGALIMMLFAAPFLWAASLSFKRPSKELEVLDRGPPAP